MEVIAQCVPCHARAKYKTMQYLPLDYQYQGQYDHLIRINIDRQGMLTKHIGNYKTQPPVSKQLSPEFMQLIEQLLKQLSPYMNSNTDIHWQDNEFVATLRFGSGNNLKILKWHGPVIQQDPAIHQFIDLLVAQ